MRDRVQIENLDDSIIEIIRKAAGIPTEVYSRDEIDLKIEELRSMINNAGSGSGGTVDLSNYYTKTDVDLLLPKKISASIIDHNADAGAHASISSRIDDIVNKLANLHTKVTPYKLEITQDNQKVFTISDASYSPSTVLTSVLVLNTGVITNYTIDGKQLTLNTDNGANIGSTLTLVVVSLEGV